MPRTAIDRTTADVLRSAIHDLKGPASRLRLLAQLLSRSCSALDEDARRLVAHIEASAADVGAVTDGLKTYSEICTRPLEPRLLDLNLSVASATANLQSEIAATGAEVCCAALPAVHADPFLMTWLFQELLTNAIRFRSGCPPRVSVSGAPPGPGVRYISVLDNGRGIEPAMAERVFRPFKKLSGGGGAGLGLTICRAIVEQHHGRIWVEPRTGGAEVRFVVDSPPPGDDACI